MCPAYRRYFVENANVFITLATERRKPVFSDPKLAETALGILQKVKAIHPYRMKGYVILPDHWHLLIWTRDGRFDKVLHSFKRNVSIAFREHHSPDGKIWQNRFYDHVIREDDDFENHLDYIHYNPVRHGYAGRPADYRFSSFHHYAERGWYGKEWGTVVPEHIQDMNAGGE